MADRRPFHVPDHRIGQTIATDREVIFPIPGQPSGVTREERLARVARRGLPFDVQSIDDHARDGRYQLVCGPKDCFAVVRWDSERWVFSSGVPLDFEPTHYRCEGAGHG